MNADDHHMNESLRQDLQRLERTSTVALGARERVRQTVMDAYDTVDPMPSAGADGGAISILDLADEEEFNSATETNRPSRIIWLAAAALVLIALGSIVWQAGSSDPRIARIADVDALDDGPILIPAGRFETDVLGTSLSFETEGEIWLVEEQPGSVALSLDPNDPTQAAIRIFRPTPLAPAFDGLTIGELFDGTDQRFGAQFQPATIGGIEARSWRVRISSESGLTDDCETYEPCLELYEPPIEAALIRTGWNDLFEVPQADEAPIMILSASPIPLGLTFGEPFGALLDSLEFGSPEASPFD